MSWFWQVLHNKFLINSLIAWAVAQGAKTLLHAILGRRFDWSRLVGSGGVPSSHSATVTALAATCARLRGLSSFEFGAAVILALIVMHDAMGVRLETGKQARVLNEFIEFARAMGQNISPEEKLKELVGHTPAQVLAGGLIGIAVGLLLS